MTDELEWRLHRMLDERAAEVDGVDDALTGPELRARAATAATPHAPRQRHVVPMLAAAAVVAGLAVGVAALQGGGASRPAHPVPPGGGGGPAGGSTSAGVPTAPPAPATLRPSSAEPSPASTGSLVPPRVRISTPPTAIGRPGRPRTSATSPATPTTPTVSGRTTGSGGSSAARVRSGTGTPTSTPGR